MRLIRVRWGKLRLDVPGEILLLLAVKTFLLFHNLSG